MCWSTSAFDAADSAPNFYIVGKKQRNVKRLNSLTFNVIEQILENDVNRRFHIDQIWNMN